MEKTPELHSPEDVRSYIKEALEKQNAEYQEKTGRTFRAKNAIWLLLLVIVFLQFYLINIMVEVAGQSAYEIRSASLQQYVKCIPPRPTKM